MAKATDSGFGLLSEFGLDLGTEDDVRSKLRQKRIQDAMSLTNEPTSGGLYTNYDPVGVNQSFAKLGATMAEGVAKRFGGEPPIPPEIQSRLETVKATKNAFEEWAKANPDTSAQERMEKYQELIAENAFNNGLPEIGINALRELQDRRAMAEKRAKELEKLGYETEYDKATVKARIYKTKVESGQAGVIEFYEYGSRDPNAAMVGEYNPEDGSVATVDKDGKPKIYRMGEWKLTRPDWAPRVAGGGGGGGGGGRGVGVSANEARYVRDQFAATIGLNRDYLEVFKLLDDAEANKVGPIQGQYGKLLTFTNKWLGFADQLATIASPTGKPRDVFVNSSKTDMLGRTKPVSYNLGTNEGREAWIHDNVDFMRGLVPDIAIKAGYANRYISMMTTLAYSKAMVSEGGSTRSLSDLDFKANLEAIGMGLNSPATLKELLLADADRVTTRLSDKMKVFDPAAAENLIYKDAIDEFTAVREELNSHRKSKETAAERAKRLGL